MALGLLPHDFADLGAFLDGRRTASAVMGVLERCNASDEIWQEMEAAFGVDG